MGNTRKCFLTKLKILQSVVFLLSSHGSVLPCLLCAVGEQGALASSYSDWVSVHSCPQAVEALATLWQSQKCDLIFYQLWGSTNCPPLKIHTGNTGSRLGKETIYVQVALTSLG